jgi:ferredoxin
VNTLIITTQKPLEEVLEMTKGLNKFFVVGCGLCAAECQTGGEKEVHTMINTLKEADKQVTGYVIPEGGCDQRQVKLDFRRHKQAIADADALLILSCGVGVQTAMDLSDKICVPGLNTQFIGTTERIGRFFERCRACGDCRLFETGGICPITRCPKNLLNAPCGGHMDGKCEVDREKDCAWILIYRRLKELDQLDKMEIVRKPRDYRIITKPQSVIWR